MPPEWAPHQATWISWPHKRESWPGKFEPVEPVMVSAVSALSRSETVRINVLDRHHEAHVRDLLDGRVNRENIVFHRFPTNDAWCRDHGAIFVTRKNGAPTERALALDFCFNAWGASLEPGHGNVYSGRRGDPAHRACDPRRLARSGPEGRAPLSARISIRGTAFGETRATLPDRSPGQLARRRQ